MTIEQQKAPGGPTGGFQSSNSGGNYPNTTPFRTAALTYLDNGLAPFPLAAGKKAPPPEGVTGWGGTTPDGTQVGEWIAREAADSNIGLRLDGDLIGIDVDAYKAAGADSWRQAIEAHGEPPSTWVSTSRELPSGIRLFRWPHPIEDNDRKPVGSLPGIETIHRGHRYMVAPPSVHPNGGVYQWISSGGELGKYPTLSDVPMLSDGWVQHFRKACDCFTEPPAFDWERYTNTGGGPDKPVQKVLDKFRQNFSGGRHDATREAVAGLHKLREWPGAEDARREIEGTFLASVTQGDDARTQREAQRELDRMWQGAEHKYTPHPFDPKPPATSVTFAHSDGEQEPTHGDPRPPNQRDLEIFTLSDLLAMDMTAPEWLIEGLWPRDAYGAIGAIYKAGKTWLSGDLVVSVASGGKWCNKWHTPAGPVLMFLGEGGRRKMRRRLEAIARHKGIDLDGLPIHLSVIPPNLTDPDTVAAIFQAVARIKPRLVLIDPLYLSAPGVQMSSIVEVGSVLREVQQITDRYAAALVLVHHWNQTGKGTGAERFSGAGVAEWGRVLVSVDAKTIEESDTFSDVLVSLEITGDEVPDQKSSFRRRISVQGDADDLTAPFSYSIEEQAIPSRIKKLKRPTTRDLILGLLENSPPLSGAEMSQRFATWGHHRKADTVVKEAEKLLADGEIDRLERDSVTEPHRYLINEVTA